MSQKHHDKRAAYLGTAQVPVPASVKPVEQDVAQVLNPPEVVEEKPVEVVVEAPKEDMVRATAKGIWKNKRMDVGDLFSVPAGHTAKWFKKI